MLDTLGWLAALALPVLTVACYHWRDRPRWTETPEQRRERERREHYARMRGLD